MQTVLCQRQGELPFFVGLMILLAGEGFEFQAVNLPLLRIIIDFVLETEKQGQSLPDKNI